MPFLGRSSGAGKSNVLLDAITTSATATYNLTKDSAAYFPTGATSLMVSLNGVTQAPVSGFTVSGSQIIFDSALASTDSIDYIVGYDALIKTLAVSDASITTSKIANGAITAAKFAVGAISNASIPDNSITTDKLVDGTIVKADLADNAVDIAKLAVTDGTNGQFLKTDGNNVLSFGTVAAPVLSYNAWTITATAVTAVNGSQIMVTGSSAVTITLPTGVLGHSVSVRNNSSAVVTIARNGSNINSTADDGSLSALAGTQIVWASNSLGWMEV